MKSLYVLSILCLIIYSCSSEEPNCMHNATYDSVLDSCVCDPFYTGENCNVRATGKFLGGWNGSYACFDVPGSVISRSVNITITQLQNIDSVEIKIKQNSLNFIKTGGFLQGNDTIFISRYKPNSTTYTARIVYRYSENLDEPILDFTLLDSNFAELNDCRGILRR